MDDAETASPCIHMTVRRIAILGAGISGLVTARALAAAGNTVRVFEKSREIGGVWSPQRHYPGLRTQTPRDCYAFSDFPMPRDYPEFPNAMQMHRYLQSYADYHDISSHIELQTAVIRITSRTDGRPGWLLTVAGPGDSTRNEPFDFVVVCNGVFSEPDLPALSGRDAFEAAGGTVHHSTGLTVADLQGRDVVVVGFGKSALDIAEAALPVANRCTLVCSRTAWKVPRYLPGRINAKHFILSRFSEFWLPHPSMRGLRRFLHERLPRLVDLYWLASERALGRQLGLLSKRMRPPIRLRQSIGTCFGFAPDDNFRAIRKGKIGLHVGRVVDLTPQGVATADGVVIPAQTVVFATGFRLQCPFLATEQQTALFGTDGVPRLYRYLVCPEIRDMAFNGYNGGGASQLLSEIGARWIAQLVAGRLRLPDRREMDAAIDDEFALRRRLLPVARGLGYYTSPFMFAYLDQLLADMGEPPGDGARSWWRRLFTAIDPADFAERRRA